MPDDIKDLRRAIGELGMSAPIVKIGTTLGKLGEHVQRGVDAVKRAVTPAPAKPASKDIVLPRSGVRRRTSSRRMSR
jgi:hypothetical protein